MGTRVSPLPGNGAFAARPAFSILVVGNDSGGGAGEKGLTLAEILRVAALPSKMLYRRVVVEVIGEEATLFVLRKSSYIQPEVVVRGRVWHVATDRVAVPTCRAVSMH